MASTSNTRGLQEGQLVSNVSDTHDVSTTTTSPVLVNNKNTGRGIEPGTRACNAESSTTVHEHADPGSTSRLIKEEEDREEDREEDEEDDEHFEDSIEVFTNKPEDDESLIKAATTVIATTPPFDPLADTYRVKKVVNLSFALLFKLGYYVTNWSVSLSTYE